MRRIQLAAKQRQSVENAQPKPVAPPQAAKKAPAKGKARAKAPAKRKAR